MLNELMIVERGARQAGVGMIERHPDVKDVGDMPTLLVQLDDGGGLSSIRPVAREVKSWTLRDGKHNSFPFVKPDAPLWALTKENELREAAVDKRGGGSTRRSALLDLAKGP